MQGVGIRFRVRGSGFRVQARLATRLQGCRPGWIGTKLRAFMVRGCGFVYSINSQGIGLRVGVGGRVQDLGWNERHQASTRRVLASVGVGLQDVDLRVHSAGRVESLRFVVWEICSWIRS